MKIRIKHFYVPLALLAFSFGMPSCGGGNATPDESVGGTVPTVAEAVDLGLPSGTLWAPYNVGATQPGEAGVYFAWGETTAGKTNANGDIHYSADNYKWADDEGETFTKYTADGKATLDAEDDAATANWGGEWQMPTVAQLEELFSECTCKWKNPGEYANSALAGCLLTSMANGNKIFLPAAGFCIGFGGVLGLGSHPVGFYWSAELKSGSSSEGCYLRFYPGNWGTRYSERSTGFPVRPVISSAK